MQSSYNRWLECARAGIRDSRDAIAALQAKLVELGAKVDYVEMTGETVASIIGEANYR
jgi:hypothetical protein